MQVDFIAQYYFHFRVLHILLAKYKYQKLRNCFSLLSFYK